MHSFLKHYHPYVVEKHGITLLPQYLGMYRFVEFSNAENSTPDTTFTLFQTHSGRCSVLLCCHAKRIQFSPESSSVSHNVIKSQLGYRKIIVLGNSISKDRQLIATRRIRSWINHYQRSKTMISSNKESRSPSDQMQSRKLLKRSAQTSAS